MSGVGQVYVIKLDRPLGGQRHQAQFYIGWAIDVEARLKEHQAGRGSAMLKVASERGIGFQIVVSVPGDRRLERWLKNKKNSRKAIAWMQKQLVLCPGCRNDVIRAGEGLCWLCKGAARRREQAESDVRDESDRVASV